MILCPGARHGCLLFLIVTVAAWSTPDHAWAEIPEYFSRLIDEGNVEFDFYDPVREPRTHHGYTTFQLDVHYRSSYRYRWVDLPSGRQLTVQPKIGRITYKLVNEVRLPHTLNHDRRWTNALVKHEFDHVAMTLDPRVRMLVDHLCKTTPEIVRNLPAGASVNEEHVERLVHQAVRPRYRAVLELLLANQHDFDRVTRHGARKLPERREYFESLFTEPNLKQHGFPYLDEVKSFLRAEKYQRAKLPYEFGN